MNAFQSTHELFGTLGIYQFRFNWKILLIFVLLSQYSISLMAFFLFKANTLSEFTDSYYAVATTTLLFYTLIALFREKMNIFQLYDDFENVIEKRELDVKDFYLNIYLNMI